MTLPKMASSTKALLTAITTVFLLLPPTSPAPPPPPPLFKKIYAFGDSFTDTGNTHSVSGPTGFGHVSSSPYGITFFHRPTNRYSDGRLVIDFVAESLSLPYLPPYRNLKNKTSPTGVNFAVAGSTAINHEFFVKNNLSLDVTPESFETQLQWFEKYLEDEAKGNRKMMKNLVMADMDEALFWVGEIGVNDYAYAIGSVVPHDTIRELAVQATTNVLQALLTKGAKYMVIQGHPPSGCLPLAMSLSPTTDRDAMGCVGSANNLTIKHNTALLAKIEDLRHQFPNAVIVYADYWNAYGAVMKNPGAFGIKEPFKACCGTGEPYNFNVFDTCGTPAATVCGKPSEYVNWDGVHLTEGMYKVLSNMFINGSFAHPPFSYLLGMKERHG